MTKTSVWNNKPVSQENITMYLIRSLLRLRIDSDFYFLTDVSKDVHFHTDLFSLWAKPHES